MLWWWVCHICWPQVWSNHPSNHEILNKCSNLIQFHHIEWNIMIEQHLILIVGQKHLALSTPRDMHLLIFFKQEIGTVKFLDFLYFVISRLLIFFGAKSAHHRPIQRLPPKFCFVIFMDFRYLREFCKNWYSHNF